MIACGEAQGGSASPYGPFAQLVHQLTAPLAYGGTDVNLITGAETSPNITQSETFTWLTRITPTRSSSPTTTHEAAIATPSISLAHRSPPTAAPPSLASPQAPTVKGPFENTFGDPVVLYNKPTSTWFASVWLTRLWRSGHRRVQVHNAVGSRTSWTHFCVHNGCSDDRESGWADNNPSSSILRTDVRFLEQFR